jgi:hypothetical protein
MKHHKFFIQLVVATILVIAALSVFIYTQFVKNSIISREQVVIQASNYRYNAPVSVSTANIRSTIKNQAATQIKANREAKRETKVYNRRVDCLHVNSICSSSSDCCGSSECCSGVCQ